MSFENSYTSTAEILEYLFLLNILFENTIILNFCFLGKLNKLFLRETKLCFHIIHKEYIHMSFENLTVFSNLLF